jgi:hypothetical protein
MKRTIFLLVIVAAMLPTPAYACSGFVDCLFGFTERTEVRAGRDIELERIQAQRDAQVADIEATAQERVRQAEAEVERVRQMRYESEAARDVAIAQAQAQADEYRAMVAALSSEKIAGIDANAQTQIVALQEAGKIHIEGITQTGITERWRIGGGWLFAITLVLVAGGLLRAVLYRQAQPQPVHMIEIRRQPRQLPGQQPAYIEMRRQRKDEVVYYDEEI